MLVKVGQHVSINDARYSGIWTVKSVGPVNAVLITASGRSLRAPKDMLIDPQVDAVDEPVKVYYQPGEIVRIKSGKFAGIYTVLADKGKRVNVAKIGGDSGRYVRIPHASIIKMSNSELKAAL
jgi:transcription antitermination factor NusG